MTIIHNLEQLEKPLKKPVLTIGNFDGVHKGHLAIFEMVKGRANSIGGQSVVMTFEPHPITVMAPGNGPALITTTQQKLELLKNAGIDVVLCIPFTKQFASISAEDFVQTILVDKIGAKEIVVGYDYAFGNNREGNIELLQKMGNDLDFTVHMVQSFYIADTLVSSTSIRKLIQEGNLPQAHKLLGRGFQVCGTVVKGKNRGGRLLGFPTANIRPTDGLIPKVGVYAVRIHTDDKIYEGLTNIGSNPTFGKGSISVETHILDFSGDLLGKSIRITFIERLRDERPFNTVKDLADQISKDVIQARALL